MLLLLLLLHPSGYWTSYTLNCFYLLFPTVHFSIILFHLVEEFFSFIFEPSFFNINLCFLFFPFLTFLVLWEFLFYSLWFLFPGYNIVFCFFLCLWSFKIYFWSFFCSLNCISFSTFSIFLFIWFESCLCAMNRACWLQSFAQSWMSKWTDLYWENTKCHYLKMHLLLGSSHYMERNFSVSCLWSKNLDASNLEGSHWNRSGGIVNLYLIPLVNKQGTLFHSQLYLVSRNLRSLVQLFRD